MKIHCFQLFSYGVSIIVMPSFCTYFLICLWTAYGNGTHEPLSSIHSPTKLWYFALNFIYFIDNINNTSYIGIGRIYKMLYIMLLIVIIGMILMDQMYHYYVYKLILLRHMDSCVLIHILCCIIIYEILYIVLVLVLMEVVLMDQLYYYYVYNLILLRHMNSCVLFHWDNKLYAFCIIIYGILYISN